MSSMTVGSEYFHEGARWRSGNDVEPRKLNADGTSSVSTFAEASNDADGGWTP